MAERAQALKEAIEADEAFRDAIVEAIKSGNVEMAVKLAADKGIEFSAEELAFESKGRDLDDDELDAVAGGGFWGDLGDAAECIAFTMTSFL